MNKDFLNNEIKPGDFVVCLSKHYQMLRIGVILDITEKTVLLYELEPYRIKQLKSLVASLKAKGNSALKYSTYRTSHDSIVFIPLDNSKLLSLLTEDDKDLCKQLVEAYNPSTSKSSVGSKKGKSNISI